MASPSNGADFGTIAAEANTTGRIWARFSTDTAKLKSLQDLSKAKAMAAYNALTQNSDNTRALQDWFKRVGALGAQLEASNIAFDEKFRVLTERRDRDLQNLPEVRDRYLTPVQRTPAPSMAMTVPARPPIPPTTNPTVPRQTQPADLRTSEHTTTAQPLVAQNLTNIQSDVTTNTQPVAQTLTPFARDRTKTFEEVYQNGQGTTKYTIMERNFTHPDDSSLAGRFWILQCPLHRVTYAAKDQEDCHLRAARHLKHGGHSKGSKYVKQACLKAMGYRVSGCTRALAAQNNTSVLFAINEEGYDYKSKGSTHKQKIKAPRGKRPNPTRLKTRNQRARKRNHRRGESEVLYDGIEDDEDDMDIDGSNTAMITPKPGELYRAYLNDGPGETGNTLFAVLALPLGGDFASLSLPETFESSKLLEGLPKHYNYSTVRGTGTAIFKRGFWPEGQFARKREYPFFCFDDLDNCSYKWICVKDLKPFDENGYDQKFRGIVERWQWRQRALDGGMSDDVEFRERPAGSEGVDRGPTVNDSPGPLMNDSMQIDPSGTCVATDQPLDEIVQRLALDATRSNREDYDIYNIETMDWANQPLEDDVSASHRATPRLPPAVMAPSTPVPPEVSRAVHTTAALEARRATLQQTGDLGLEYGFNLEKTPGPDNWRSEHLHQSSASSSRVNSHPATADEPRRKTSSHQAGKENDSFQFTGSLPDGLVSQSAADGPFFSPMNAQGHGSMYL